MSRSWKDPDDVQQDMLDAANRTNQLLEQILSELKNHFADGGKKVVCGLDEGDPKGDESVIVVHKSGEEEKPAEEKKPLVIVFDADGPKSYCIKCNTEAVFDKIERKYYCPHCRRHLSDMICQAKERATCPVCGRDGELVHNGFGVVGDWVYCKHCGVSSRLAR